jgi:hypothetical protein
MKEITECISDIGQANSNIFSTLDLTSRFWQMKLDEKSQPLTAFTILRSIPLGHLSHGTTGLPRIISTPDGWSTLEPSKCYRLHQRPPDPLGHSRTASPDLGTSSGMASSKPLENQSGEMYIWQQGSLLSGFHINSRRNQTRQEQTQGDPDSQASGRHQNNHIFHWIVQFLPDTHQGLRSDSCSTVQAHSKRFRIQGGSFTRNRDGRLYQPWKAAHFRTSNGLSQNGLPVRPDHRRRHWHGRDTRRTQSNTYTSG